jgi:hypothetical protein
MATIRIAVIDPSQKSKTSMEVPDDVAVGRLLKAMVKALGLPATQAGKQPPEYSLSRMDASGRPARLDASRTLAENNVHNDELLHMISASRPGGSTEPTDSPNSAKKTFWSRKSSPQSRRSDMRLILAVLSPAIDGVRYETVKVDPLAPLWRLISSAVTQLSLPMADTTGQHLTYHLELADAENRRQRLPLLETPDMLGLSDKVILDLVGEPVQLTRLKETADRMMRDRAEFDAKPQVEQLEQLKTEIFGKSLGYGHSLAKPTGTAKYFLQPDELSSEAIMRLQARYFLQPDEISSEVTSRFQDGLSGTGDASEFFATLDRLNQLAGKLVTETRAQAGPPGQRSPSQSLFGVQVPSDASLPGQFLITAYIPRPVQCNQVFDVTVSISLMLDMWGWLTLDRKESMVFDIVLVSEDLAIFGPPHRQVSLPVMPGTHQLSTTFPVETRQPGRQPLRLQVFQSGRYLGELELEMEVVTLLKDPSELNLPHEVSLRGEIRSRGEP